MVSGLRVESGSVSVLRLFDVARAIDLGLVERAATASSPTRLRLSGAKPKAISYGEAPLGISLSLTC